MTAQLLISGFMMGAISSVHCVGMCGPLSLALPTHHLSIPGKICSLLLYQFGRIITYSILGLITGILGRGLYLAGYQQFFSVIMGSLIVIAGCFYFMQKHFFRNRFAEKLYAPVQQLIIRAMNVSEGYGGFLLMGMANGLLPCGMVYLALATSLSFGNITDTIGFMALYGAGTLPAMMAISMAGSMVSMEMRRVFKKVVPAFVAVTGIILILRGMNLGIPFISPNLPATPGDPVNCAH